MRRRFLICCFSLFILAGTIISQSPSGNFYPVHTGVVSNTHKIVGQYAYINLHRDHITTTCLANLYNAYVKDNNYAWFTICLNNNKGYVFSFCNPYVCYGPLDKYKNIKNIQFTLEPLYDTTMIKIINYVNLYYS